MAFWFSQHIKKETFPFCAQYTTASLLSSSLPCWPPNWCHIFRLRKTLQLSYVPVSRFLQVDLNPRFCESAIIHGHRFSDVSHLYSWERFVMRQQWEPENLSFSIGCPKGKRLEWTVDSVLLMSGVHHFSLGVGGLQRTAATRWRRLITMLSRSCKVLSLPDTEQL